MLRATGPEHISLDAAFQDLVTAQRPWVAPQLLRWGIRVPTKTDAKQRQGF